MRKFWLVFVCYSLAGCEVGEYAALEKAELESGVRKDSLFEGLYLGMSKADFRARSFQLNQDCVFTDGASAKVRYKLSLKSPATLLFFPEFIEDRMESLPATIQYDAWAPWNEHLSSTELINDMKRELMEWYGGNPFYELKAKDKPSIWVKVDGNRRITIVPATDGIIKVLFKDLTVDENLK